MARQGWRKWGQVKKIKKKKRERAVWAQPMTVGKWEANCSIHISPSPSPPTNTISYHHLQVVITRAHMALSWPHPLLTRQHQSLSFSLHEAHADMVIPRWYDDGEMCACFAFFQPLPCFVCLWFGLVSLPLMPSLLAPPVCLPCCYTQTRSCLTRFPWVFSSSFSFSQYGTTSDSSL